MCYFFEKSKKGSFFTWKISNYQIFSRKNSDKLIKNSAKSIFRHLLDSVLSFKSSKFFILKQKSAFKRILTTYNIKILREYQAYFEDIHVISN